MHIRKYVKWRQIENGSVLFNTQTGDWLTLNKNATFIFLQRYVNYNPMESIAENLVMKYPASDFDVLLEDVKETLQQLESSAFFSSNDDDRGFINLIIPPYYLETLNIKVTNSCNLSCKHCLEGNIQNKNELPFEQMVAIIDDACSMGANEIVLTGGEPFMRDDIVALINYIDSLQMKATIFTNGTMVSESFFESVKGKNVFMRVSLEGATEAVHDSIRGTGSYAKATKTMQLCKDYKIPLGVAITVNSTNFDTYKDIIELAHSYGAVEIEASDVIDMGYASENRNLLLNEEQLVQLRIETLFMMTRDQALARGMGVTRPEYLIDTKTHKSRLTSKCCNAGIANCVVDTNGDIYPCLMFVGIPEFVCGNTKKTPFRDIWWDNSVLSQFRNMRMGDISECAKCDIAEECAGGCRAKAYLKSNDLLGSVDKTYCNVTRRALNLFKESGLAIRVQEVQNALLRSEGKDA